MAETEGILTFRGLDLHRGKELISTIHFDLVNFDAPPEYRGEDRIMPEAAGRFEGARQADRRLPELEGFVRGFDPEEYRTLFEELRAVMEDPTPGELVVGGGSGTYGYLGIPLGVTYSLNARPLNQVAGRFMRQRFREFSYQLECIDSPPDWVEGGS